MDKVIISDNKYRTRKEIIPNSEVIYIIENVMVPLGLHDHVKTVLCRVDPEFWCSAKILSMGQMGKSNFMANRRCPCKRCNPKPITELSEDKYVLFMSCCVYNKDPSEIIDKITKGKFVLTKGPRDNFIMPIKSRKETYAKKMKCVIIPKPETLEALKVIQKANNNFTMDDLIINAHEEFGHCIYNHDLVDKVYIAEGERPPENIIESYTEIVINNNKYSYEITFEMLAIDLKNNMEVIKEFLTALSKIYFS